MWLALDTSCLTLSLALVRPGGDVVEALLVPPPAKQSDVLPGVIGELLTRHGRTPKDLTGLISGLGPGSFTGLRIGLSCLKGLAWSLRIPLVGVSSLEALALEGPEGVELFCASVVKKNELYLGRSVRRGEDVQALEAETWLSIEAFAQRLVADPSARMLGPAVPEYRQALLDRGVRPEQMAHGPFVPSAVALARLAEWPRAFDLQALYALEPHYLRGSGAEENPKFPPLPGVQSKARLLQPP
jgi:tRNA threonylcarbamoyladenosine biosynthesis protein TsaB